MDAVTSFASFERREGDVPSAPWRGSVREARVEEASEIAKLIAEREHRLFEDVLQDTRREFATNAREAGAASRFFVAEEPSTIVGFGRVCHEVADGGRPGGWYLLGVIVAPEHRRRGVGLALTLARIEWLRQRADAVYYFANVANRVSIAPHEQLGFVEVTRDFEHEKAGLKRGEGVLYRLSLDRTRVTSAPKAASFSSSRS